MNDTIDIEQIQNWARVAGQLALEYFQDVTAERKADNSIITRADIEVEQYLTAQIRAAYPLHGIIGEEEQAHDLDAEYLWALDPIDGTASFAVGLPIWGVSIAVYRRSEPVTSVFYLPVMDEMYHTMKDAPAYCNDRVISVNGAVQFDNQTVILAPANLHRRARLNFGGKVRSYGSTAAHLAYVARGAVVGAVIFHSHVWDIAAAAHILRNAGGTFRYLSGAPVDWKPLFRGVAINEGLAGAANDEVYAHVQQSITVIPRR